MGDKKVENIIKQRLENFESDAPMDSWDAIEAAMGDSSPVPFYKKRWVMIPALLLLVTGLIVTPILFYKNGESTSADQLSINSQKQDNAKSEAEINKNIKDEVKETENNQSSITEEEKYQHGSNNEIAETDDHVLITAEENSTVKQRSTDIKEVEAYERKQNKSLEASNEKTLSNNGLLNADLESVSHSAESNSAKPIIDDESISDKNHVSSQQKTGGELTVDINKKVVSPEGNKSVTKEEKGSNDLNGENSNSIDENIESKSNGVIIDGQDKSSRIANKYDLLNSELNTTGRTQENELFQKESSNNHKDSAQDQSRLSRENQTAWPKTDNSNRDDIVRITKADQMQAQTHASRRGSTDRLPESLASKGYLMEQPALPDFVISSISKDEVLIAGPDPKEEVRTSKDKNVNKPWGAYFYGMPTFSYNRIESNRSDDILINSVEKVSPFSLDRLGFRLEAGIQRAVSEKFNVSLGVLYWHSNQEFNYNTRRVDSLIASSQANSLVLTPQFSEQRETYNYSLRNVGLHLGGSFNLSSKRLVQQLGGGVEIHKALNRPDLNELVIQEPDYYLFYNIFYRMEYPRDKPLRLLFQPTFNYSLSLDKNFEAPFYVKPYGFGLNFGFVYRF